jgi:hypothetical protein
MLSYIRGKLVLKHTQILLTPQVTDDVFAGNAEVGPANYYLL